MNRVAILSAVTALFAFPAVATTVSPTVEGELPAGISAIGGVVLDIIGTNGNRVVSQTAASSLFVGYSEDGTPEAYRGNPLTIGIQGGFGSSVYSALGGGIAELSVRITLQDGDTAPGDFDDSVNTFLLNGEEIGDFSLVETVSTDSVGAVVAGSNTLGFADEELDTGFFYTNDATVLAAIYSSIVSTEQVMFQLADETPGDNFYDFTQGIDSSLIDVGTGPVVTPPSSAVPLPAALPMLGAALGGLALVRRRKA